MNLKTHIILLLSILIVSTSYSQEYNYEAPLSGISSKWHKIRLNSNIYEKSLSQLSDIRIIGYDKSNIIEAPYILKSTKGRSVNKEYSFKRLNSVSQNGFDFTTFELEQERLINEIELIIEQTNFDCKINLEASQDRDNWYTIKSEYRIISIDNKYNKYTYSKINFEDVKYKFFRISIPKLEKLKLNKAVIKRKATVDGRYSTKLIQDFTYSQKDRHSEIIINLDSAIALNSIKINTNDDDIDYYRSSVVKYAVDSIKISNKWQYNYRYLYSKYLSSLDKESTIIDTRIVKSLKIIIENGNNQALDIKNIELKSVDLELIVRMKKDIDYKLVYGKRNDYKPDYDIVHFKNRIPTNLSYLKIGEEQEVIKEIENKQIAFFKNKAFLWILIISIVLILGFFSFRMLKESK